MSVTDLSSAADPASVIPTPPRRNGILLSTWLRVVIACLILVASGGVRVWQTRRVEARLHSGSKPAFDLDDIPMQFGPWKGQKTKIDDYIARGTGADKVVTRRYINQDTGAAVDAILLYGPAVNMFIHMPELCYPAAGFTEVEGAEIRPIVAGDEKVPFRSLVYTKGVGVAADLQEVYYTWRYNDRWTPDVENQKAFERIPGMYKVHLARRMGQGERRDLGNPCEALLEYLVPDMKRRLEANPGTPVAKSHPIANHQ